MNKELFNQSGCKDITAYKAIRNVSRQQYYPMVYICSPFSGDVKVNSKNARKYSRFAVDKGNIPLAPHLLFPQFMSEETERKLAMHFNYVLLGVCDELWVFEEKISDGMAHEIDLAKKRKMKIRYFSEELTESKFGVSKN